MTIGIIGKYVHLKDCYKSLHEALVHGGLEQGVGIDFEYIDAEDLEGADSVSAVQKALGGLDAVLVPGGFGDRGVEGKINAIRFAREQSIPYFGICLGMQLAVIEYARNVCGIRKASSEEFSDGSSQHVIHLMPDQHDVTDKGGTMRLGAYPCKLNEDSRAATIYGSADISERHRHRFELNNEYREQLSEAGLIQSGTSPDDHLVEIVEVPDHPHFIGCQFHPEFKSRPLAPHPLFSAFVQAAVVQRATKSEAINTDPPEVPGGEAPSPAAN